MRMLVGVILENPRKMLLLSHTEKKERKYRASRDREIQHFPAGAPEASRKRDEHGKWATDATGPRGGEGILARAGDAKNRSH